MSGTGWVFLGFGLQLFDVPLSECVWGGCVVLDWIVFNWVCVCVDFSFGKSEACVFVVVHVDR